MEENNKFELHRLEYVTLKAEQLKRIEHRDHIIYLQVLVIGVLFGLTDKVPLNNLMLLLPFPSVALGWTYLINDEKVSSIGKYIREGLNSQINEHIDLPDGGNVFGWEISHASDRNRTLRKLFQLFIDLMVFVLPGVMAVLFILVSPQNCWFKYLASFQGLILLVLCWQIVLYADLKKRSSEEKVVVEENSESD